MPVALPSLPKDGSEDISKVCYAGIICCLIAKDVPSCTGIISASFAERAAVRETIELSLEPVTSLSTTKGLFWSYSTYTNQNSPLNSPIKSQLNLKLTYQITLWGV